MHAVVAEPAVPDEVVEPAVLEGGGGREDGQPHLVARSILGLIPGLQEGDRDLRVRLLGKPPEPAEPLVSRP